VTVAIRTACAAATMIVAAATVKAQCTPVIQQLVDARKFDEARVQSQAAVAKAPNDDRAIHCLGRVSLMQNRTLMRSTISKGRSN